MGFGGGRGGREGSGLGAGGGEGSGGSGGGGETSTSTNWSVAWSGGGAGRCSAVSRAREASTSHTSACTPMLRARANSNRREEAGGMESWSSVWLASGPRWKRGELLPRSALSASFQVLLVPPGSDNMHRRIWRICQ
jgi:hypothetical protein